MKEFSEILRELRIKEKLSQEALGNIVHVSRSAIAKYENGLGLPSEEVIQALCNYFKVDKDYLFPKEDVEQLIIDKNKIIYKQKKRYLFITLFLCAVVLILTALFIFNVNNKKEKFEFQVGRYEYLGEEVIFFEDIVIDKVYLDLEILSDINKNTITNRKNHRNYNVDFIIVTSDGLTYSCDFNVKGKWGEVEDQVDRYYVNIDISEVLKKDDANLELVLEFNNPEYYNNKDCTKSTEIIIEVNSLKVEQNVIDSTLYDFPEMLYYVEEE